MGGGAAGGLLVLNNVGDSGSLMLPFNWIWQLVPLFGTVAFTANANKKSVNAIGPLLLGVLVVFNVFLSGSRGITLFVAGPVFFFLFYYNWDKGVKFWSVAVMLFFIIIAGMEIQERFRGNILDVILKPQEAVAKEGLKDVTSFDPTKTHRDNNMYLMSLIFKYYPSKYPHGGFNSFFAVILNPIPRVVWPGKPFVGGNGDLADVGSGGFINDGPLTMGTLSLSFSIVGEAFIAAGFLGILIYALTYGIILLFLDGIFYYAKRENPVSIGVLGMSVFLSFWGFRAFFALISFIYPLLVLVFILKRLSKQK